MFDKLNALQAQMEEMKQRLSAIHVEGAAEGGKVKVIADGNKNIVSVQLSDDIMNDKEQLEDLLVIAMNRAMESAENVNKSEMQSIAGKMLPGLGGLLGS